MRRLVAFQRAEPALAASTQASSGLLPHHDARSHLKLREFGGAGAWISVWARASDNWTLTPVIVAAAEAGTLGESLPRASVSPSVQTRLSYFLQKLVLRV